MRILFHANAVLLATLLGACATPAPRGEPAVDEIERALEAAANPEERAPVPPPEVLEALLPPVVPPPEVTDHARFDVNVQETPARDFFMGLVEGTPYNLVVHPEVSGSVSLRMKNVTVQEVLEAVRDVYGYDYRPTANGWIVMSANMQTRVFQMDYLDMRRSGVSRTRVSSGQVSEMGGSRSSSQAALGGQTVPGNDNTRNASEVTGSRVDTSYDADFWGQLRETLALIVGQGEGRRVVINPQSGVIMVHAMPEELRAVETFLEMVQDRVGRQVILEAKIIEVVLDDRFQAGINWAAVAETADGDTIFGGAMAPTQPFDTDFDDLGGAPISVAPGVGTFGFDTQTIGSAFTLALDIGDFNAFVELLEVQGETRVLSSPRVATLNNQKAVIKAGTDEFFVTDVSSNTVTGTASATSRDVELTPFFSGIALDVTPQISSDGSVTLHIHPTVSDVTDQQKDLTISGETDRLPLAFSEVRESDSVVRARSGQLVVIGGLMRTLNRDESFGTPVLSRIPGVGALFRSKRNTEHKTELVILLKPTVIDADADWAEAARASLERIRGMSRR